MTWSRDAAQRALARAIQLRGQGVTEAVLRTEFESWLRRIFPDAADQTWANHYVQGAEAHVRVLLPQGGQASRFIDALVRGTNVEYESNLRDNSIFQHGLAQVREYVAGTVRAGLPISQVRGLLSDTVEWYVYDARLRDGADSSRCTADDIELTIIEEFRAVTADDIEADRFGAFLRRHLAREESRPLSAQNIASDLGLESLTFRDHVGPLTTLVDQSRAVDASVALATDLWSHFVDGLERQNAALRTPAYVDELYVAILARLLAANVLNGRPLVSADADLESILRGEHFAIRYRLQNMVEDDYFGWVTREFYIRTILPIARSIQRDLAAYDFSSLTEHDLFGRLMSQLSRRSHRKLLGQEFTPEWLADRLASVALDRLPAGERPQFVDMCCGSGSIMAAVLREVMRRNNVAGLDELRDAMTGFDVDPLAVILAKTTWVVTLAEQVRRPTSDIRVPIYHADSLFATTPVSQRLPAPGEGGDFEVDLDGRRVVLPTELISPALPGVFDAIVDWAYDEARASVRAGRDTVDDQRAADLVNAMLAGRGAIAPETVARLVTATRTLAREFSLLALANRNGIWAFVLRNAYRPGLLVGSFNGLVSNPPWLAMSQLAANPYVNVLTERADLYGISPGGSAHLHLELATTFLLHATDRYLRDGAVVACLLPGTIFNGSHHQRFRDREFLTADRPVALDIAEVWEVEGKTFKVRSAAIVGSKRRPARFTPDGVYARVAGQERVNFEVRDLAGRTAWILGNAPTPLGAATDEPPPLQGADLMPRAAVCVDVVDRAGAEWRVETPGHGSTNYYTQRIAKKLQGQAFPGFAAPEFVHSMVQSLNVVPFATVGSFPPIAIPARRTARGAWQVRGVADIRAAGHRQTAQRFERIDAALAADGVVQPLAEKINTRNKLVQQAFAPNGSLVLTGAGGKFVCAAMIPVRGNDIVIDQTLYWKVVDDERDAWYRVGILNSTAITDAITPFNPRGEFGERHIHTLPHRVIPTFDPENESHLRIGELAQVLCARVQQLARADQRIGDLAGALASRRARVREAIEDLAEKRELERLCAAILGTTPQEG